MTDYAELDAKIAAFNFEYVATFVPFSQSRNAKVKPRIADLSVNWKIAIRTTGVSWPPLETDYMQGIGHLPAPLDAQAGNVYMAEAIRKACEHGVYPPRAYMLGAGNACCKPLPPPLLRDVLHCLVLDAEVLEYATFEDWAEDTGYDTDSRKAEEIYRTCLAIALKLRAMIGNRGLSALRTAFQDY